MPGIPPDGDIEFVIKLQPATAPDKDVCHTTFLTTSNIHLKFKKNLLTYTPVSQVADSFATKKNAAMVDGIAGGQAGADQRLKGSARSGGVRWKTNSLSKRSTTTKFYFTRQ